MHCIIVAIHSISLHLQQYELEKEFEKQEKLKGYGDDSRAEHEAELQKLQEKHNQHEKVHHPGNKAQLEEVWDEQDHMNGLDFDPQTFFMMHGTYDGVLSSREREIIEFSYRCR